MTLRTLDKFESGCSTPEVNGAAWRNNSPLAIQTGQSEGTVGFSLHEKLRPSMDSHHGFLDKRRKPAFKLILITSNRLEAEVRFLKLLSARLVFI